MTHKKRALSVCGAEEEIAEYCGRTGRILMIVKLHRISLILAESNFTNINLIRFLPLGLQVRQILQEQNHAG